MKRPEIALLAATALLFSTASCSWISGKNEAEGVGAKDAAAAAGVSDEHFVHAAEDYFHDMDNGVSLTPDEIKGRNMWLVWTGGNDRFWDTMSKPTLGGFDLLKIVAPLPDSANRRAERWTRLGLVNEPCFKAPTQRDSKGLWLDQRRSDCAPDPFANAQKYPGVKTGALGRVLPVGSYYGEPTGIVGLRLFPNPDFNEQAAKDWKPDKYYNDPGYYENPKLIRPYRVGMSCGFCHVGPSPIHPPADPANPTYAELNSTVGAQYMWVDRLFFWDPRPSNFMFQLVSTYRPGAMDTSLVSTDNINNPRSMNAIYSLGARLDMGKRVAQERLGTGSIDNKQFNDFVKDGPLTAFYDKPFSYTPHVLKDGADSAGALAALNRVYLNIGLYSEEWLNHFNPVVGGKQITPITIATARRNSPFWRATEAGTPDIALFFLKAAQPDRLADAPGGAAYLSGNAALLPEGRAVFAETCARCHSSKQPRPPESASIGGEIGPNYLERFKAWWAWTQTPEFKSQMRAIAERPDFLDQNYLSTDVRIPQTLLRTNMCSPLATNAIRGNIWDNFSSESYKNLPSIGTTSYQDPFTGEWKQYSMPAGGRGFTRPPSLIALWSSGPYLLNNALGPFNGDPSVKGRLTIFDASIKQLLWPEKRDRDHETPHAEGLIDRTSARSFIYVPDTWGPTLPGITGDQVPLLRKLANDRGEIELGPIPKGMPVNLLASLQILAETDDSRQKVRHYADLLNALLLIKGNVLTAGAISDEAKLRQHYAGLRAPLMALSKCPDFVVNRGHYFGTDLFNTRGGMTADERSFGTEKPLTDLQKRALIAFLETL